MRLLFVFVFVFSCLVLKGQNDSVYIYSLSVGEIKSKISKYNKGNFYDLAFVKPEKKQKAVYQSLKPMPKFIIFSPEGQKLCRKQHQYSLPSKMDINYIKANFQVCFKQFREDENGEKIPELIPYELDQFLTKTKALCSKKNLNPKAYTIIFPWRNEFPFFKNKKINPELKSYFKSLYKSTKKQNYNLIRLNRDIQKSWGFGDSLGIKIVYKKN